MSNFKSEAVVQSIEQLLRNGESLGCISARLQVAQNTVRRYRRALIENEISAILCPCGKTIGHRGWCSWRYSKSEKRQSFMSRWRSERPSILRVTLPRVISPPRAVLNYPFMPAKKTESGVDLLLLVNGFVPKGLPEQLRGDVCQDVILAVLSGELLEVDIPSKLATYIRQARRVGEANYMAVSIDQPRRDGSSWHDILSA